MFDLLDPTKSLLTPYSQTLMSILGRAGLHARALGLLSIVGGRL